MPVHDWTRVDAGIFHDFHHEWISTIKRAFNGILKGTEYYALAEQVAGGLGPDVLTLQLPATPGSKRKNGKPRSAGVAVAEAPPKLRYHITNPAAWYAAKKKSVTIRHVSEHRVVAVLEIVSPGNKSSRGAVNAFLKKTQDLLAAGVHFAMVDVFPPTRRDPEGLHPLVWGEDDDTFRFDPAKPLTCASYVGGLISAFVEPVAVGDKLPALPVFLTSHDYIEAPLETTYKAAFDAVPDFWREKLQRSKA
jgi:hypothetical protein